MKYLIWIFLGLIFLQIGLASEMYNLEEFSTNPIQDITVNLKDFISFNLKNGTHIFKVDKIFDNNVGVVIFPYRVNASYASISPETSLHIDLDQDYKTDIKVNVLDIQEDKVKLRFEALGIEPVNKENISEEENNLKESLNEESIIKKANPKIGLLIILIIIIIGIIISVFITRKQKRRD